MFIGFDYGTANCSVAVMRDGKPHLLKMENDSTLLPSMLCAPTREAVSEWLYCRFNWSTQQLCENMGLRR
ncbi:Hsp70 family protein, partial [Escherichia coli]|nr:Hsp70 family protein [Escherichia coli]